MYGTESKAKFEKDGLEFLWDFDGATLGGVQRLGPDWYFFGMREDTWFWFYFKIKGCKNRQIIFETKYTRASFDQNVRPMGDGNYARKPFYSYNNRDFSRFDYAEKDTHEEKRFRYIQTFTEDEAYICFGIPYTPLMMEEFINEVSRHPDVSVFTLGHTRIGLPIKAMTIGAPKPSGINEGVVLLGREDQDETTAQYAYEGFIKKLLSDEYKPLREQYEFFTVPVVSLDAQKTGAQYSAGFGYASIRWDGNRLIPEYIKRIKEGIEEWAKNGIDIKMAGKFHSPGVWDRTNYGSPNSSGAASYKNGGRELPTFCIAERRDVMEALCKYLGDGAEARSTLEVRPVGRFERYIRDTFGVDAVWCVEVAADNVEQARNEGVFLLKGISEWLDNS